MRQFNSDDASGETGAWVDELGRVGRARKLGDDVGRLELL